MYNYNFQCLMKWKITNIRNPKIFRPIVASGIWNVLRRNPGLSTQSCIKGLFVVLDFCFLAVWAAGLVHKKSLGPIMSNFWGRFFHVFRIKIFWKHSSACNTKLLNKFKKKSLNCFWILFGLKLFFFRAAHILECEYTT